MSKNILIVDDDEDVQEIAKLGLEMGAGWHVLTANSGDEALNIAANNQLDAILLDMMMPDMDGRVTLQKLKANPVTETIPVILLTAKVPQTNLESFPNDVVAVFPKPFRPLKLAEQISQALDWP